MGARHHVFPAGDLSFSLPEILGVPGLQNIMKIPFNKPYMTGKDLNNISQAHALGHLAGDGGFTKNCQIWPQQNSGSNLALLMHSCTAAL